VWLTPTEPAGPDRETCLLTAADRLQGTCICGAGCILRRRFPPVQDPDRRLRQRLQTESRRDREREIHGRTASDVSERSGGIGRTVGGLGRRRSRDEPESDRYEDEEPDQYDEDEWDQCEKEPAEDGVDEELEEGEVPEAEAEPPEVEAPEAEAEEEEEGEAEGEDTEQYEEYAREDEAGVVRQTRSAPA
jgi:hypothetical protein